MLNLYKEPELRHLVDLPNTREVRLAAIQLRVALEANEWTDEEIRAAVETLKDVLERRQVLAGR